MVDTARLFDIDVLIANTHVGQGLSKKDKDNKTAVDIAVTKSTSVVLGQEIAAPWARIRFRRRFPKKNWHVIGPTMSLNRVGTMIALRKEDWEIVSRVRRVTTPRIPGPKNMPNLWPTRELTAVIAIHKKSGRRFRISNIHTWFVQYDNLMENKSLASRGHFKQVDALINFHGPNKGERILDISGGDTNEPMQRDKEVYIEKQFSEIGMKAAHKIAKKGYDRVRVDDQFVSEGLVVSRRIVHEFAEGIYGVDHHFVTCTLRFSN